MKLENLSGKKFGYLNIIGSEPNRKLLVKCDCGLEKIVSGYDVLSGKTTTCGKAYCPFKSKDLKGKKFNLLTVIGPASNPGNRSGGRAFDWDCKCECGNKLVVPSNQLVSGRTKSCGCSKGKWIAEKNKSPFPIKDRFENSLYYQYGKAAKNRGYEFLLTKEEFVCFIYENCFYCNAELSNNKKFVKKHSIENIKFNGIDRIDNTKGYVMGNCVTCCALCNRAKMAMPINIFYNWLENISKNLSKIKDLSNKK